MLLQPIISLFDSERHKNAPLDCKDYAKYLRFLIDYNISWNYLKKKIFDYITLKISKTGSSFYYTIIAIFIEYPAGASAEERETGG